jgi:hypothetical protein
MEGDLYAHIAELQEKIERLERKEKLSTYIYPHNAWIREDVITFCYDEGQRKALGSNDKMIFNIKTITLASFKAFLKSHAKDLNLYPWLCMEGGNGYYDNVIDRELYNQCFTIRLSECLHRMIESDNELKLSLMKEVKQEFHERNR